MCDHTCPFFSFFLPARHVLYLSVIIRIPACPSLTLPARHKPISFLPVLYFTCPSFLRFPACPSLYFTCPSLSDFLPSCPSLTLLARPLFSSARAFPSILLILRLLLRRLLLPLLVSCKSQFHEDCRATLAWSALQTQLQFCVGGISRHWVEVCLDGGFSCYFVQEENLRIGRSLLLQRGFVGRHRASEPSFFLRA